MAAGPVFGLGSTVQAKLTVNQPGDRYEREADAVAEQVTAGEKAPAISALSAGGLGSTAQRQEEEEEPVPEQAREEEETAQMQVQQQRGEEASLEESEETVAASEGPVEEEEEQTAQTKAQPGSAGGATIASSLRGVRGGGHPLPSASRAYFEPRFGRDFSQVRVHTDAQATESARALEARAFTTGCDIVFRAGQYAPGTAAGNKLLAHELTHVVQQGASREIEGDQPALSIGTTAPATVQRSPISDDVEKVWNTSGNANDVLARLSRPDAKKAAGDADLAAVLKKIYPDADDRWVAERIVQGKLGMTKGIKSKKITASPVKALFFRGTSDERALVIAGVHGTERQGMAVAQTLINDLQTLTPYFNVIIVPSLFPDHQQWGSYGKRERATPTNRNFPADGKSLAEAPTDRKGNPLDAKGRPILPENIMLMQLMERFHPSRIISIHGTQSVDRAGVFSDPLFVSASIEKGLGALARGIANLVAPVLAFFKPGVRTEKEREQFKKKVTGSIETFLLDFAKRWATKRTASDEDLAIETAYEIAKKTNTLKTLKKRGKSKAFLDFVEKRWNKKSKKYREAVESVEKNPAVAGNRLHKGKGHENPTWLGSTKKGVSLGSYAPGRGMSVFTVEPAINRNDTDYPTSKDPGVSAADRTEELQAYTDAVRKLLLGDPTKMKTP